MVSIIKNQLLKHLSRYTKNLSPDKINLSTFRGEGSLSNLQLDENVLTELLELPSWLRLTSAWCNQVSFHITWTKLKSVPICLILDEVNITVETCESARIESAQIPERQALAGPQGKYSFIHKVIDGITVVVNTVNVKFKSPAFTASVQMSKIRVESKTPKWMHGDLRITRLKDTQREIILIFKELSWQTVRIEASSTQDMSLTPLRLLTNQARCRITIRKKMSDCSILASRLVLILDDLLWVLTDSQLNAALHFADSLYDLIKTTTHVTQKTKAQKKLETLPEYQAQIDQQSRQMQPPFTNVSSAQKMFNTFDVHETSYHFFSQRIDLHLCDDIGDGRSCFAELSEGGALQTSVQGFQIDFYPYHLAKSNRSHWAKYKEAAVPPALWLEQSLNTFREDVLNMCQPNRPPLHAQLERVSPTSNEPGCQQALSSGESAPSNNQHWDKTHTNKSVLTNLAKLMSACVVVRIEDFTIYRVTTSGKKQMPKEFIAGDKDRYSFPAEMPTIHAEFTYFYYPGEFIFPLPPSKVFVYANPIQINYDEGSLIWFNSFALNLHESLRRTNVVTKTSSASPVTTLPPNPHEPNLFYMDVKLEAIMPRIAIESLADIPNQRDRPKVMQIQISRFTLTNLRELGSSRADLAQALQSLQEGSLVFGSGFPSAQEDKCVVTDRILSHVAASDITQTIQSGVPRSTFTRYAMWSEPRDVWCMKLDPIWIDFLGAKSLGQSKTIPFIDAVPVTLWIHGKPENDLHLPANDLNAGAARHPENVREGLNKDKSLITDKTSDNKLASLHVIAHVSNLVSIQIDHYQYLFLLRLSEELTELTTFLNLDSKRISLKQNVNTSIIMGCVVPQVEITLVMPSQTPGKGSSGDAESVLPDSASLGDDLHFNSTNTVWQTPPLLEHVKNSNAFGSVETPSPISNEPTKGLDITHVSSPNTHGYNVQIQSSPKENCISQSQQDIQIISVSTKGNKNRNSITDFTISKDLNSGIMSMKKGFSSFMTSIDSAIKQNTLDDLSDTFSVYSDVSSDSENFGIVMGDDKPTDCMDVMFRLNPFSTDALLKVSPVEVASEVCEELNLKTTMSSPSEPSEAISWRRRDLVSMVTFRLTTVEVVKEGGACVSSIRLQVAAISCDECGAIPWDELQVKFGARCRAWNIAAYNPEASPCIQMRFEENINTPKDITRIRDKSVIKSWFSHRADIFVRELSLDLSMSTVIGLGDLLEDEVITKPVPLKIILDNFKANITDDRPPINITSPGTIPINLEIVEMIVTRDENRIIHVQPKNGQNQSCAPVYIQGERDREVLSLQLVVQQLKLDNENYKKRLTSTRESLESNRSKSKQEMERLRNYLKAAQENISSLLDEKTALLETIRSLKQQVNDTENIKRSEISR